MDLRMDAIDELADNGARQREAYARYGLAMYTTQVFEHGLVNAIVLVRQVSGTIVDNVDWDRIFDSQFKKVTSELARRVGSYGGLRHRTCVAGRRRCRTQPARSPVLPRTRRESMSSRGMQRMLEDADAARELFLHADEINERLCAQALDQLGVADTAREQIVKQLRDDIRERDGD